ncbi:hypothetical protein [Parasitella parasitica]|uniref:Uncharacterized protein n=1 Tax=Parasitella parasitica TaxID=35722 RepID=A0A0B7NFQ3_9FUNG|nr:hypothetical protein [Parasitella parasitica]
MQSNLSQGRLDLSQSMSQVPPGPPSPTLSTTSLMSSVSWMAEKTSSELIPMLKSAYCALKDKEKDLVLAAELGKSLLEHNLKLKSSYDSLLQSGTPPITPSSSTAIQDEDDSGVDSPSSDEDEQDEDTMRFIPSRGTREAMMEVLERKNMELQAKLDTAIQEQDDSSRTNLKKTRQLECEISILKSNLDIASTKIQELQEMNERQRKMELSNSTRTNKQQEDDGLLDELYIEIDKIQLEKDLVSQSKSELESKLAATLKDLGDLKKQFEKFEFTQQDFDKLHEAYERQFSHIDELNQSLEEHRAILQKLKDKGISIHSTRSTPAPSCCNGDDQNQNGFRNTLLGELESEWMKNKAKSTSASASAEEEGDSCMFQLKDFTEFTEKKMSTFYNVPSIGFESVLSKATGIDQDLLDDAIDFINKIEREHNQEKCANLYNTFNEIDECDFDAFDESFPTSDLYPRISKPEKMQIQRLDNTPKTFVGHLRAHLVKLFNLVCRWCRFSIILTTALLINAWQGPDALLMTC